MDDEAKRLMEEHEVEEDVAERAMEFMERDGFLEDDAVEIAKEFDL